VWHLWIFPVRAYALCIIAGIIAALVIGDRRWAARGGERGVIYDIALWAVPFGLIGGRLYHLMTDWQKYFGADGAGFLAALRIWDGGLGIWGAVALGGVGAWIACRRRHIPLPAFGDAIAPGIILAQAIGRLGNYFNQELYGRETDLPWGLTIYERLDPSGVVSPSSLDGVSTGQVYAVVHPTFLYELLWNLLIFAMLLWVDRRFKIGHGRLFALYVAGYCVGRFWVELMRSDTATLIAGIRVNSFTSTFVFLAAVIYVMVAPKGREDPATLGGTEADGSRLDDLGDELVAVAATSGIVAAAKVAGDEDKAETAAAAGTIAAEPEAESGATESEAAAEAEDLVEQLQTTSSEEIAEAESFAAAGAAADEPEAGLGPVEGDDAVAAETAAPEAHEAAVEGADEAEAVAEEVAAEPEPEPEPEAGVGSVEGDEIVAAAEAAPEVHEAAVDGADEAEEVATEPEPELEPEPEPEAGVGSVEGDDAVAAETAAPEVHEAAVEGADEAEAVAEEVAGEPEPEPELESEPEPEAGVGSVEGDEDVVTELAAEDVAAEPEPEPEAESDAVETEAAADEPDAGLGSVEGDDAVAAETAAPEAHEAAVEGAQEAEATAEEVAAESQADAVDDEPAKAPEPVKTPAPAVPTVTPRKRWWRRS
jgi:prolipoprotein diacylglyceryl transferase